ncbi:PTS sugar transporter subunit IIA [Mollicutes bacterium LVI A0039]|nr:PTS sugar transporter subunit IIA [Mollicutes bacterium LVI A0039]
MKQPNIVVLLNQQPQTKAEAINLVGNKLVEIGSVKPEYVSTMHTRDQQASVYMGNDLAIPHGTDEARDYVITPAIVIMQVPKSVSFDANKVRLVIGIAADGDAHMEILGQIAVLCSEMENVDSLVTIQNEQQIISMVNGG